MKFSTVVSTAALVFSTAFAAPSPLSLAEIVQGVQAENTLGQEEQLDKRNVITITATYNGAAFSWLSTIAGDGGATDSPDSTTTITKYVTLTTSRS